MGEHLGGQLTKHKELSHDPHGVLLDFVAVFHLVALGGCLQ